VVGAIPIEAEIIPATTLCQRVEKEEPQRRKTPKLRDLQSYALSGGFDGGTGVCATVWYERTEA